MEIRHLHSDDDRKAVSRVYEKSWRHAYRGIIPDSFLDGIKEGNWVSHLDNPGVSSLVMTDGGEIIGTSSFSPSRFREMEGYGEIISVYLLPEYMGRGCGAELLKSTLNELAAQGYKDVFLWVLEENHGARRFYERFGFKESGRALDDNIGGKALKEIQYVFRI